VRRGGGLCADEERYKKGGDARRKTDERGKRKRGRLILRFTFWRLSDGPKICMSFLVERRKIQERGGGGDAACQRVSCAPPTQQAIKKKVPNRRQLSRGSTESNIRRFLANAITVRSTGKMGGENLKLKMRVKKRNGSGSGGAGTGVGGKNLVKNGKGKLTSRKWGGLTREESEMP